MPLKRREPSDPPKTISLLETMSCQGALFTEYWRLVIPSPRLILKICSASAVNVTYGICANAVELTEPKLMTVFLLTSRGLEVDLIASFPSLAKNTRRKPDFSVPGRTAM